MFDLIVTKASLRLTVGMLEIKNLVFTYPSLKQKRDPLFNGFDLTLPSQKIIGVIGQNGSGKTTLLHLCANLLSPAQGTIFLDGSSCHKKQISYLFQNDRESLLPWLCLSDNITFDQLIKRVPQKERANLAKALCEQSGIKLELNRFPYELSGGQQQMVSILRGFAGRPDLFILDEPFSSLDTLTRQNMLRAFKYIWRQQRPTCLFVSHDIDELFLVAHHIVVLGDSPTRVVKRFDVEQKPNLQQIQKNEVINLLTSSPNL
mgnify:CR=1 FL=1